MAAGFHDHGLLRPGSHRQGGLISDAALIDAIVEVEAAWLAVLGHPAELTAPAAVAADLEQAGNPVVAVLSALREQAPEVHVGLTSQDTLDTALMLMTRRVLARVGADAHACIAALAEHAERHRDTLMTGRTLTQSAVPITFGLKAAQWLVALNEAADALAVLPLPVQCGGAAGTLSLIAEKTDASTAPARLAAALVLDAPLLPWHTRSRAFTAVADALTTMLDALGTMAADIALLSRPEIGELSEGTGGGSSTMPHKHNPILSVLIRSASLQAPALAAGLHLAAGQMVDERPDGAWHAQWSLYRDLLGLSLIATSQARDLIDGLVIHDDVMQERARHQGAQLLAEKYGAGLVPADADPAEYLGQADALVTAALRTAPTLPRLETTQLASGSGDVLIVGAGLGTCVATLWGSVAPRLKDVEVVGVDLPGHGASPIATRPFTVASLASAVREVAREYAWQGRRVWYAGVSLAGAIALELSLRPGPFAGVVSIASASRLGTPAAWVERADLVRRAGTAVMVSGSAQRWFAPGFSDRQPAVVGAMLDDLIAVDDHSYALCCQALAAYDIRWELSRATIPVTLIPGELDVVVTPQAARADAARLPQAEVHIALGAAHQPPAEVPAELAVLLNDLVGSQR